jgi:ubiquinone/menaquinone biosynthesis C-methylase UbiE
MKIDFQETTNDLLKRIDIHSQFGARDIDSWMLDVLQLQKGLRILDVGCGAGKQCFSFHQHLDGDVEITGTDVSESLLAQARQENEKHGADVKFQLLDFNHPFALPNDYFDLISACFAIYYAQDIPFTLGEMHRVLKPGGRLFTTVQCQPIKRSFMTSLRKPPENPSRPCPAVRATPRRFTARWKSSSRK